MKRFLLILPFFLLLASCAPMLGYKVINYDCETVDVVCTGAGCVPLRKCTAPGYKTIWSTSYKDVVGFE